MRTVDLNCDFGEGYGAYTFGQDEALLRHVTSVNIACGFHAGDPHTIREAVEMAVAAGTEIGAHPGLPDRVGFGRREMAVSPQEVYDLTLYQIGALDAFVRAAGGKLRHVKPHGALYHMTGKRVDLAEALVRAVRDYDKQLLIYGQSGSVLTAEATRQYMTPVSEVFADRTYMQDGSVTSRSRPDSVVSTPEDALRQALTMVTMGAAPTIKGGKTPVQADTICLHGDGPHAAEFAKALRQGLEMSGVILKPHSHH
ncbi:LamB/YcsF family protein [Paenibacillus sp. sptzw28]|nr:LamB/YcsF family protein [Paenibacillus sp. sptzw28]